MKLCSTNVYHIWPKADNIIKTPHLFCARNSGGPGGLDSFSRVWAVAPDPLKVPRCCLCLCEFVDGSPITIRYRRLDIFDEGDFPWLRRSNTPEKS